MYNVSTIFQTVAWGKNTNSIGTMFSENVSVLCITAPMIGKKQFVIALEQKQIPVKLSEKHLKSGF